jgi:hypothetical protein
MMTRQQFDDLLRNLLRRRPFVPIEVALIDGKHFVIDRPDAVSTDGGAAGFIAEDGEIHFFNSKTVQELGNSMNGVNA